ncbi:MAG TPA: thioredoxin family protein [Bryobacteraceae bacterium]|nr:thioredoxin family protein [Bryobacteraceae bacterium]
MLSLRRLAPCLVATSLLSLAGTKSDMHWKPEAPGVWDEAAQSARPMLVEAWADWCEPCRWMDRVVWSNAHVIEASQKFVQISVDMSRRDKNRLGGITLGKSNIQMVRALPTIMLLDPWGETLLVVEGTASVRELTAVLNGIPADYSSIRAQREALLSRRNNSRALADVGLFYQRGSSIEIANRYYKEALSGSGAKEDDRLREELTFGIAMNDGRLSDWKAARKRLEEFRAGFPNSTLMDQVLYTLLVADVKQNKGKDARQHLAELQSSFPGSKLVAEASRMVEEYRGK